MCKYVVMSHPVRMQYTVTKIGKLLKIWQSSDILEEIS